LRTVDGKPAEYRDWDWIRRIAAKAAEAAVNSDAPDASA
jgi:hypothetical protein